MPSCWFRKQLTRRLSKLFSEGLPLNCNSFTFDGAQCLISFKSVTSVTMGEFLQKLEFSLNKAEAVDKLLQHTPKDSTSNYL